jgi:hypothetical protein
MVFMMMVARILLVLTMASWAVARTASGDAPGPKPQVGNFTRSLTWGKIDENVPPVLGNGDVGGLFDPFGGTTYDELRFGSGAKRDIRALLLTQVMLPDYWVLEDQAAHFLDPRYYRPTVPRRYLTLGAPFTWSLRPTDAAFPEKLADHQQTLDITTGRLTSRYRVGEASYAVETIILPDQSVIAYHVTAGAAMRFEISPVASPDVAPPGNPANTRYQQTRNGYHAYESEPDLIVLKQVSNVFCPAYAAVAVPGKGPHDNAFLLNAGKHDIFVAIGHQSLGQPHDQAVDAARRAARTGYASLRAAHERWWQEFWNRSYVSLPDKRLEQMWYRSVYYLACCLPRRVRSFSPEGAYGIFPANAGFHPQDSVYQLFAAISSNHPELCKAQIEYLLETLPMAEAVARNVYYLEGARYPWHATPGLLPYLPGHTNEGYYLHEHHVNGWLAEVVRRYLQANGWERPLVERYYPVLREIARFFSSMLTARGNDLEITYVPSCGQEESNWDQNRKNLFDMLVAAKWSLMAAAEAAKRIDADAAEAARWQSEAGRINLDICLRPDGTYGSYEHDDGHPEKVPSQLIGVVMTSLFDGRQDAFARTFDLLRGKINIDTCSWAPGYYAIAAARLKRPEEALRALQDAFRFSKAPWLLFVENTYQVPGRLPYYLAAHGLFVQGVNELLLQDWSGKVELFPACPFSEAAFKLRGNDRTIEARLRQGQIEVLADKKDTPSKN